MPLQLADGQQSPHPKQLSTVKRHKCRVPSRPPTASFHLGLLLLFALSFSPWLLRADSLESGFQDPPASAKPHTWWHWMNGNVTKEGITADLEAMKRVGIGGAQIFNAGEGIPAGPVRFMSPEWREMFKHAAKEADRLGIELCLHNCAGWSSSGGPWNTPEHAMQHVVITETKISGGKPFAGMLPQPATKWDFYRDIAVLAFRTPDGEGADMKSFAPKISTSGANLDGGAVLDGNANTFVTLPTNTLPQFVQLEFAQPFATRSVMLTFGQGAGEVKCVIQVSDDGKTFRDLRAFTTPGRPTRPLSFALGSTAVSGRFFRVQFTGIGARTRSLDVAEINLSPRLRIENVEAKDGDNGGFVSSSVGESSTADNLIVKRDETIDLSSGMNPDGHLDWDPPAGEWTILRIGYTPTGRENHPAPPEATGPECDKFSTEALDAHWAGFVQKVIDDLGPLAGKGKAFNNVLIDSYEVGGQNWTAKFREEFQARCGYDPVKFLPTFTGRVVDSPAVSERFLWDVRRTISDLFAENYYGHFKELCDARGLTASIEPYTGPYESLRAGAAAEIPMGEFWVGQATPHSSVKLAASVGHIYGRPIIGAESFTASPGAHGRWLDDAYSIKALGDQVFCSGVNRYIFHRYAMQPWTNRWPGMTMGQWGTHFDRTSTWWEQSRAWLQYVTRSQFMLQQGRFVADAAYFCGENSPVEMRVGDPALPPGYDFDAVGSLVLETATVKDGRLVLKSGMKYRVLILPPTDRTMTPGLLRKIRSLVADGLTLVGTPPEASPSLNDFPECDAEVKTLATELWGNCDGKTATENKLGKGKAVWGQPLTQVLTTLGAKPDFEFASASHSRLSFIHRLEGDAEIYFVSNQRDRFDTVECTFRVSGKAPELWHSDSGVIERAPVWREENGRTIVPLQFDPAGSVFVVFRKPARGEHAIAATPSFFQTPDVSGPKISVRQATYSAIDGAGFMDVTEWVGNRLDRDEFNVTASNDEFGRDPAPNHVKQLRLDFAVDGKPAVAVVAENESFMFPGRTSAGNAPRWDLLADRDGDPSIKAWANGRVDFRLKNGRLVKAEAANIPAAVEVGGAWTLSFPPNWGAPETVTLDKLTSWTDSADKGVKFFSGTATYQKEIEIPKELFGRNRELWLDLGRVKNFAEVSLNGRPLGILWKPPFRVNATGAAKPGKNKLEIKVTNLWPNRLIGDEQLPEDREWNGKRLREWPQWVLDGKPSPTGRFTFTTWHHWTRNEPLLESGLIGPVTLRVAETVMAK